MIGELLSLYRVFNADENLLYVGITNDVDNRLRQHSQKSWWWHHAHHYEVDSFERATRAEMKQIEKQVIQSEKPLCNREHYYGEWARQYDYERSALTARILDALVRPPHVVGQQQLGEAS